MKILFSLIIIIIFKIPIFCDDSDFSFKFVNTPKGNNFDIGLLKLFNKNDLILSQYEKDIFYKAFYSTDKGINWIERDKNAMFIKESNFLETLKGDFFSVPQFNYIWDDNIPLFEYGLYFSTDFGQSWEYRYGQPFITDRNILMITTNNVDTMYITSEAGYYKTTDYGVSWAFFSDPLIISFIYNLKNSCIFYCTDYLGLIKIDKIYEEISPKSNFPEGRFEILKINDDGALIGYSNVNQETNGIYISEDDGYNWRKIKAIEPFNPVLCIEPYKNAILAGDSKGLEISYDYGLSWHRCTLPPLTQGNKSITRMAIDTATGDIYCIYGGTHLIRGNLEGKKDIA